MEVIFQLIGFYFTMVIPIVTPTAAPPKPKLGSKSIQVLPCPALSTSHSQPFPARLHEHSNSWSSSAALYALCSSSVALEDEATDPGSPGKDFWEGFLTQDLRSDLPSGKLTLLWNMGY